MWNIWNIFAYFGITVAVFLMVIGFVWVCIGFVWVCNAMQNEIDR